MPAADDGWNARVELGRRLLASMLEKPAEATLEEMEAALLDEVERQAHALADINALFYSAEGSAFRDSEVMQREARAAADHARALVAAYQLAQALNRGERPPLTF